jgi:general secretion pathway protein D
VKTILSILLLTSLGLVAQIPPALPSLPATSAKSVEELSAPPTNKIGGPPPLRRTLPPTTRGTVTPAAPATPDVAASIPAGAAATPPAPAAPTTAVDPAPAAPTAPVAVTPQPLNAPEEETIPPGHINWTAADLPQVLATYADLVGRSILRPAALAAPPIVFKNQTALTKREFIQALDALLALNGIAMISVGDKFVKAVLSAQAGAVGGVIRTNDARELPELGGYHTHIVQLKYVKPSEVLPVITPFASVGLPPPIPIESSQLLVIRDNAENVKRMLEMIERVDVTVESEFVSEVIPIKFAKVADIASALNSLSGGGGGGGTTVGTRTGATRAAGMTTGARGIPGQPGYSPGTTMPGAPGSPTGTPSSGASFSDRIRNIITKASSASGSGDLQIIGVTKIVADERSNSLLIFATRADMAMIKDIVNKLDVVLAQVLIETIIMDVSLSDSWALGVSAGRPPQQNGKLTSGSVMNNPADSGGNTPLNTLDSFFRGVSAATNALGAFPSSSGFSWFGRYNKDIDVVVQAAASDSRVNVIQKPRIQTSHATPASIFIGNTVPYVSGSYYGGGFGGSGGNSYQQLRVGIGLSVTPFINQDGLVVMQVDETIDEISGSTAIVGVGEVPNTTSRTISAEVAVRDGETIILGGFIRNSENNSKSGVPYLKDIPLLGYLFRSTSKAKERKELIVLMRPTVLRTPELASLQVDKEKQRLRGVIEAEKDIDKYEISAAREILKDKKKRNSQESSDVPKAGLEKSEPQKAGPQKFPRDDFNKVRPFTPEEEKLYGNPAPVNP